MTTKRKKAGEDRYGFTLLFCAKCGPLKTTDNGRCPKCGGPAPCGRALDELIALAHDAIGTGPEFEVRFRKVTRAKRAKRAAPIADDCICYRCQAHDGSPCQYQQSPTQKTCAAFRLRDSIAAIEATDEGRS